MTSPCVLFIVFVVLMLKIYNMYFSIINQVVQFVCLWMQDLFNYTINVSYVVDALTKYFFFSSSSQFQNAQFIIFVQIL